MAFGLADYFDKVWASDIFDYGFGDQTHDFLGDEPAVPFVADWIITNPPFSSGEAFVRKALKHARRGVAMLLRSVFLESGGRYALFNDPALGFALHAQFAERVPMVKGRWDPGAASATAYSWFVWVKSCRDGVRVFRPAGFHLGCIIPPGTKARLSRREDLTRFCGGESGPLFGGDA